MSNTKLSKTAKNFVKADRARFEAAGVNFFSFPEFGVTVAVSPDMDYHTPADSSMVRVSVSICSHDEEKFRKWTGIANVIQKLEFEEFVKVVRPAYLEDFARQLAVLSIGYML